jgi:hypothetical protein
MARAVVLYCHDTGSDSGFTIPRQSQFIWRKHAKHQQRAVAHHGEPDVQVSITHLDHPLLVSRSQVNRDLHLQVKPGTPGVKLTAVKEV